MNKRTFLKLAAGSLASFGCSNVFATQPTQSSGIKDAFAIVFFFLSTCPDCHRFAPKLRHLQSISGMPVYAFSIDGKSIPDFPKPMSVDEQIYNTFFPADTENKSVPATFFINVNTVKFVRMTIGDVSYDQLTESFNGILNSPKVLHAISG